MKKIIIAITLLFLMTTQVMAQAVYEEYIDDFSGEDNSYVYIDHSDGDEIGLGWGCISDGLNIITAHSYMGGDANDRIILLYKFDDEKPSPEYKFYLSKNKEFTLFSLGKVPTFTQKALSSNQVMIRIIDPFNDEKRTSTFKLDGLSEALPKLSCYP